jgi:hypothetical protein
MGINSHIVVGDILAANDGAQLYNVHPDRISGSPNLWEDDVRHVCNMRENDIALVLAVTPAGSTGSGCAFYVMTSAPIKFGWVMNHVVRGHVTLREPGE